MLLRWSRTIVPLLAAGLISAAVAAPPTAPPTAQGLLRAAEAQARAGHKNVLIIFHASWCGWCNVLDNFMKTGPAAPVFARHFTVVRLDVDEQGARASQDTPGAGAIAKRFGGTNGLPFLVMLHPGGALIATSNRTGNPDSNVGYPVKPGEVAWFVEMMHRAVPTLSAADLNRFRRQLVQFNHRHKLH